MLLQAAVCRLLPSMIPSVLRSQDAMGVALSQVPRSVLGERNAWCHACVTAYTAVCIQSILVGLLTNKLFFMGVTYQDWFCVAHMVFRLEQHFCVIDCMLTWQETSAVLTSSIQFGRFRPQSVEKSSCLRIVPTHSNHKMIYCFMCFREAFHRRQLLLFVVKRFLVWISFWL